MNTIQQSKPKRGVLVLDTAQPMYGLHGIHAAFRDFSNVEITAIADSGDDIARRNAAMSHSRATRHYTHFEEMFDQEKPDFAILCSRHPSKHLAPIRAAAARGIHLFCEKPLAETPEAAREIEHLVKTNGIACCAVHAGRYDATFLEMKRLLESGAIGKPLTAIGRGKCDHRGGGEDLIVLGTHILDLMVFFFGDPLSVMADIQTDGRPATAAELHEPTEPVGLVAGDNLLAIYNFPNGVRGTFESRKGLAGLGKAGDTLMGLAIVGTEGTLTLRFNDYQRSGLKISRCSVAPDDDAAYEVIPVVDERIIPDTPPADLSLCGQQDIPRAPMFVTAVRFAAWDFLQAIDQDRQPISNSSNARTVSEMIAAAYTSHFEARQVALGG